MTRKTMLFSAASVILFAATGFPALTAAQAAPAQCTKSYAEAAIAGGNALDLCGCTAVSRTMIRYVQRRADFLDLLGGFEANCAGLANILADVPTASTGAGLLSDDERSSRLAGDPGRDEEVTPPEPEDEDPDGHEPGKCDCEGKGKGKGNGEGHGKGNGGGNGNGNCNQGKGDHEKGKGSDKDDHGSDDDHDHSDKDGDDHDHSDEGDSH